MKSFILLVLLSLSLNFVGFSQKKTYKVSKSNKEWKRLLNSKQYYILREAGTERPFSSPLNKNYNKGIYVCVACKNPLYKSEHKYNSGTGWPSFDREIKGNVTFDVDYKIGYARKELKCNNCGGHLGHLFKDGPAETTGIRHCINGFALEFIPTS
ncbi:MAG: peptide-methionine (R)-S-oxide reductase MsrB [Tenacibaculum sp.]